MTFQSAERLVQRHQVVGMNRGPGEVLGEINPHPVAAVLVGLLAAGGLDEDAAHGLGRGGEEVPPAVPLRGRVLSDEAQVGLVNECGRLERVIGRLGRHAGGGELAQLVVDQRQQSRRGVRVAGVDGGEDARHVGHGRSG